MRNVPSLADMPLEYFAVAQETLHPEDFQRLMDYANGTAIALDDTAVDDIIALHDRVMQAAGMRVKPGEAEQLYAEYGQLVAKLNERLPVHDDEKGITEQELLAALGPEDAERYRTARFRLDAYSRWLDRVHEAIEAGRARARDEVMWDYMRHYRYDKLDKSSAGWKQGRMLAEERADAAEPPIFTGPSKIKAGVSRGVATGMQSSVQFGTLGAQGTQASYEAGMQLVRYLKRAARDYPDVAEWIKGQMAGLHGPEQAQYTELGRFLNQLQQDATTLSYYHKPPDLTENVVGSVVSPTADAPLFFVGGEAVDAVLHVAKAGKLLQLAEKAEFAGKLARVKSALVRTAARVGFGAARSAGVFGLYDAVRVFTDEFNRNANLSDAVMKSAHASAHGALSGAAIGATGAVVGQWIDRGASWVAGRLPGKSSAVKSLTEWFVGRTVHAAVDASVMTAVTARVDDEELTNYHNWLANFLTFWAVGAIGDAHRRTSTLDPFPAMLTDTHKRALWAETNRRVRGIVYSTLTPEQRAAVDKGELDIDEVAAQVVTRDMLNAVARGVLSDFKLDVKRNIDLFNAAKRAIMGNEMYDLSTPEGRARAQVLELLGFSVDEKTGAVTIELQDEKLSLRQVLVLPALRNFLVRTYGEALGKGKIDPRTAVTHVLSEPELHDLLTDLQSYLGEQGAMELQTALDEIAGESKAKSSELDRARLWSTAKHPLIGEINDALDKIEALRDAAFSPRTSERRTVLSRTLEALDRRLAAAHANARHVQKMLVAVEEHLTALETSGDPKLVQQARNDRLTMREVYTLLASGRMEQARKRLQTIVDEKVQKFGMWLADHWNDVRDYAIQTSALSYAVESASLQLSGVTRALEKQRIRANEGTVLEQVKRVFATAPADVRKRVLEFVNKLVELDKEGRLPEPPEDVTQRQWLTALAGKLGAHLTPDELYRLDVILRNVGVRLWVADTDLTRAYVLAQSDPELRAAVEKVRVLEDVLRDRRVNGTPDEVASAVADLRDAYAKLGAHALRKTLDDALPYIIGFLPSGLSGPELREHLRLVLDRLANRTLFLGIVHEAGAFFPAGHPLKRALDALMDGLMPDEAQRRVRAALDTLYPQLVEDMAAKVEAWERLKPPALKQAKNVEEFTNFFVQSLERMIAPDVPDPARNPFHYDEEIAELLSKPPEQRTPEDKAVLQEALAAWAERAMWGRAVDEAQTEQAAETPEKDAPFVRLFNDWMAQRSPVYRGAEQAEQGALDERLEKLQRTQPMQDEEVREQEAVQEALTALRELMQEEEEAVGTPDTDTREGQVDVSARLADAGLDADKGLVVTKGQWRALDEVTKQRDFPRRVVTLGVIAGAGRDASFAQESARETMRLLHTFKERGVPVKVLVYVPPELAQSSNSMATVLAGMLAADPRMTPYVDYVIFSDFADVGNGKSAALGALVGNSHALLVHEYSSDRGQPHVSEALDYAAKDLGKHKREYYNRLARELVGEDKPPSVVIRAIQKDPELRAELAKRSDTATLVGMYRMLDRVRAADVAHALTDAAGKIPKAQERLALLVEALGGVAKKRAAERAAQELQKPASKQRPAPEKPAQPKKPAPKDVKPGTRSSFRDIINRRRGKTDPNDPRTGEDC